MVKSVRALGAATLLFAAVAVATGLWWYGSTASRAELTEERAAADVTQAQVRAVDVLVSQAIVFALDGEASAVESDDVTQARRVASDAIVALKAAEPSSEEVTATVRDFREQALAITELLATGDVAQARSAYAGDLGQAREAVDATLGTRAEQIASELVIVSRRIRTVSVVSFVAAGLALVGVLLLIRAGGRRKPIEAADEEIVVELPGPKPVRKNQPNLVIQLPTGPNTLTPRRRYPKVEDLGWLIGQVMKPYRARGWEMSLRCPAVGADCDPADVREILHSLLRRAEDSGADSIGIAVKPKATRVEVIVADDGPSIFGPDSYLSASEPVQLRSSVRTRTESDTAQLTWSRTDGLNVAVLDLPRLGIVVPIGVDA